MLTVLAQEGCKSRTDIMLLYYTRTVMQRLLFIFIFSSLRASHEPDVDHLPPVRLPYITHTHTHTHTLKYAFMIYV